MLSKAPEFWYKKPINKVIYQVLHPLSRVYTFFAKRNYNKEYKYKSSQAYVVAIGGITVGGSGKTPVVASMCKVLKTVNRKAAILSRGFGRNSHETLKVDNKNHTFRDVGDEPLLLSEHADVFVGADRMKSAKMAEESGHNLLILDDGLTQRDLQPNAKIIVVDSTQGFGNGEMLPLGPNRLNFDMIKDDINGVVIIKAHENENIDELTAQIPKEIPLVIGYLEEDFSDVPENGKLVAFCGIGYPKKFFNSVKRKFNFVEKIEFPDHHPFSDEDIVDLLDEARLHDARLVTTEKDFVRIPRRFHNFISVVRIKVVWKDTAKIAQHLNLQA